MNIIYFCISILHSFFIKIIYSFFFKNNFMTCVCHGLMLTLNQDRLYDTLFIWHRRNLSTLSVRSHMWNYLWSAIWPDFCSSSQESARWLHSLQVNGYWVLFGWLPLTFKSWWTFSWMMMEHDLLHTSAQVS